MSYSPDDLETLNEVLTGYPDVRELVDRIRDLGDVSYPIDSFAALSQLNRDDSTGSTLTATLSRAPAYYFPIASLADLVAKLLELRRPIQPERRSPTAATPSPLVPAGSALGTLPPLYAHTAGSVAAVAAPDTIFLTEAGPLARPKAEYSAAAPPPEVTPAPDEQ